MHLTRGGSVQRPLPSGLRGWPTGQTRWRASPTLQPLASWILGYALQEAVTRNPKLEVSGNRTWWPPDHVAMLAGQHLARYRLNQVSNSSSDPYKYPPTGGIQDTTLYL
jgi:hypothetical protein